MAELGRRAFLLPAMLAGATSGMLLTGLSGCGASSSAHSNTPKFTVSENGSGGKSLLTEQEVKSIDGLADVQAKEVSDVQFFENPDPRGPCGGVVPQIPAAGAVGRAFVGSSAVMIELLSEVSAAQTTYVKSILADHVEGCGTFTSTTNTGDTQTVSETTFVPLKGIAGPAIGWTSRVDVGKATAYAGIVVLEAHGQVAFLQLVSGKPVRPVILQQLATLATTRQT